jgi:ribonuclease P protein component
MYCYFQPDPSNGFSLRVGFAVPSRVYDAVRRNRLKRLMREAFRIQRGSLLSALQQAKISISLVFVFKKHGSDEVSRLRLHPVLDDMADLSSRLIARLG